MQVNEPNPAGGTDYVTTHTYDVLGHLTGVSMPRPTGTRTRTFSYVEDGVVACLMSAKSVWPGKRIPSKKTSMKPL